MSISSSFDQNVVSLCVKQCSANVRRLRLRVVVPTLACLLNAAPRQVCTRSLLTLPWHRLAGPLRGMSTSQSPNGHGLADIALAQPAALALAFAYCYCILHSLPY